MKQHVRMTLPVSITLAEVRASLCAVALGSHAGMNNSISQAFCADLMSDVLAYSVTNSLLITGLTSAQVIRTAEVANINAIVFVLGKKPDATTIRLADSGGIVVLSTPLGMFEACGRLYEKGLGGRSAEAQCRGSK